MTGYGLGPVSVNFRSRDRTFKHYWQPTFTELIKWAKVICKKYTTLLAAKEMKDRGDDWMAHDIYFICDTLLFCKFKQAVAFADSGQVLHVMKYWAFAYHGCGQHNYA